MSDGMDSDDSSVYDTPVTSPRQLRASSLPLRKPEYTVGYVYSDKVNKHSLVEPDGGYHPECPDRITYIRDLLNRKGLLSRMREIPIRKAVRSEVLLAHAPEHWDLVLSFPSMSEEELDAFSTALQLELSLYVNAHTTYAALLSCGGVIDACLAVARGELLRTFAIVRPPGHHAEPDDPMGFCFLNNVAVAARVVQKETSIRKILIVDWDVHHGNGIQRAFYDDPSILYISLHRHDDFFPLGPFGGVNACGEGAGLGFSVNIPWSKGEMEDADYISAFHRIILPIATEFSPDMVIISCGFDAAVGDPLGDCYLTPSCYAQMTHMLAGLAGGRVAVALEGGYNLKVSAKCAEAVIRVLLGEAPSVLEPLPPSASARQTIWKVCKQQSLFWRNIQPLSLEPDDSRIASHDMTDVYKMYHRHNTTDSYKMLELSLPGFGIELGNEQVFCTSDLLSNNTVVIFVHEYGHLHGDLSSVITGEANPDASYIVDHSRDLLYWALKEGYAVVNVSVSKDDQPDTSDESLLTYIWDNHIQLCDASQIILIGQGCGCRQLLDAIDSRQTSMSRKVKAVIQIVGHEKVPKVSKHSTELQGWYYQTSLVILPYKHKVLKNLVPIKRLRYGNLTPVDASASRIAEASLPKVIEFIASQLTGPPHPLQTTKSLKRSLKNMTISES